MKPADLFTVSALVLLAFALLARFIGATPLGVSISWRGSGYVLPPELVSIAMATGLCFYATIYSLWMLPLNRTAISLHFWLTAGGITVFWVAFYRAGSTESNASVWVAFLTPAVVLLAQVIFLWNLAQAILKMPRG